MRRVIASAALATSLVAAPGAFADGTPPVDRMTLADMEVYDRLHGVDLAEESPLFVFSEVVPRGATPAERAAAQARVQARLDAALRKAGLDASRPAGFAGAADSDDSADPIEDGLEQVGGSGGEEETQTSTTDVNAGGWSCSSDAWFKKRKLYFTPFYSSVYARVSVQCNEPIIACTTAGWIGPSAWGKVVGTWFYDDGDVQDWCTLITTKAYMVNRVACLGFGLATIVSADEDEMFAAWGGGC